MREKKTKKLNRKLLWKLKREKRWKEEHFKYSLLRVRDLAV
jgi:hypothetical protein